MPPGLAPGVQPQMVSTGGGGAAPGQRLSFAGLPPTAPGAAAVGRPMQPVMKPASYIELRNVLMSVIFLGAGVDAGVGISRLLI